MKLKCECGAELEGEISGDNQTIVIQRCVDCANVNYNNGYMDGKKRGYDEGVHDSSRRNTTS